MVVYVWGEDGMSEISEETRHETYCRLKAYSDEQKFKAQVSDAKNARVQQRINFINAYCIGSATSHMLAAFGLHKFED